ncbi:MAG TPA: hypothetical protein VFW30_11765 [Bryocella sp.]|nr:hypothetical protein [Bryocella sp.]
MCCAHLTAETRSSPPQPPAPSALSPSPAVQAFDSISLARVTGNLVMTPGVAAWFGIGRAGVCARLLGTAA